MSFNFQPHSHLDLTVTLIGIEPPIWRRLHVPLNVTFARLHGVLQAAFGWKDAHLHEFIVGGLSVCNPSFNEDGWSKRRTLDAESLRLRDLRISDDVTLSFEYVYDFGDNWRHWICVNRSLSSDMKSPECVEGARNGPPEDAGGVSGYEEFLAAWRDPSHPEHRSMRRWTGRAYDPESFDLAKVNKAIRSAFRGLDRGGYATD